MTLRIDYLSPLPPVRSGISDYSVDLLPHLTQRADVRVLRLPDLPLDDAVAQRFEVREGAARAGEDGRLPLYQMGNNRYHAAVWDLAHQRPGVVVLHDLVLHHFLLDRTVGQDRWEPYRDELERCHGWIGDAAARPVRWGAFGQAAQFELPANRTLLERNRGVLVHGRWAAERLAEEDPRLAVRVVPMGIPLPDEASRERGRAFRRAHSIPADVPLIGSFGFQTPIKRTDVAIRALARPGLERVHLLIAGELSPYSDFATLASRVGVAERVHVTGFLPFEELDAAIAATELCLNLRYPSAGETSASLLRILAVGRAVIVSDYAELGELPDEIAIRVPLGAEEEERFAALVAEHLSGHDELAEMGQRARRYVAREHDPEIAATRLLGAVEELARLDPPGAAPPRVPLATSVSDLRPRGAIEVRGLEGWRPGERRTLEILLENQGQSVWRPSSEVPGGLILEIQLTSETTDHWRGHPWLTLDAPLGPGERRRFAVAVRRPLEPARLVVRPKVVLEDRYPWFGDWWFECRL